MFKDFEICKEFLKMNKEQFKKINNFPVSYIFGKNGSGKTTFSREIADQMNDLELFIFNKDYVYKNIHIEEDSNEEYLSSSQSPKNKKNTANIFLGSDSININNEIIKYDMEIKENKRWFDEVDGKKLIKQDKDLKCNYTNDFLIKTKREIFKNNDNREKYLEFYKDKREDILSLELANKYGEMVNFYNDIIRLTSSQNINIENYNKFYNKNEKSIKIIKLHELARDNCEDNLIEFLGSFYKKEKIIEWLEKYKSEKTKYISKFTETNIKINEFIINFFRINNEFNDKDAKNKKKIINNIFNKNEKKIIDNSKINYKFDKENEWNYDYNDNLKKSRKWVEENRIFIIFDDEKYKIAVKKLEIIENNNLRIIELKKQKIKIINNILKKLEKDINFFIQQIAGEKFDLSVGFKQNKETASFELSSETKNLNKLSEGEKSTLALSYFFANLKHINKINKKFIIFIDDPFDSHDHFKYDNLPKIKINYDDENVKTKNGLSSFLEKINNNNNNVKGKLIIATHNVNVLSAFIRSLFNTNIDDHQCFRRLKDFSKDIGLFTLKKDENIAELHELNKELFFPIEYRLTKQIYEIWKKFYNENFEIEENNKKELQIFILLSALLTKLCENDELHKERQVVKGFVYVFKNSKNKSKFNNGDNDLEGNLEEFDKFKLKVRNQKEINFEFNDHDLNGFIKKYSIKNSDPLIVDYLLFIKDRYKKILNSNDEDKLRRLRHKNNFYSSPIGHILEEI